MQSFRNPAGPTRLSSQFSSNWTWLVDQAIPTWVKRTYSPKESWKDKPFSVTDVGFFLKSIHELSELFTEERPRELPAYFKLPKFRSAYLLYFLPLQAAKFLTIFHLHPEAMKAALEHGRKTGTIRIADLGAGPGTASIAFLIWLLDQDIADLPSVEMDWFDTNGSIMEDGRKLVEVLSQHFPALKSKVTVRTHALPWWKAPQILKEKTSLTLVGHVLNESASGPGRAQRPAHKRDLFEDDEPEVARREDPALRPLSVLASHLDGGGLLIVEPAARRSSQQLSQLRDQLFEGEILNPHASSIWGPCPHAEACPLAIGRDWCHFSVPVEIPGQWFRRFSQGLGSERNWVKFSYFWAASETYPSRPLPAHVRRIISDSLKKQGSKDIMVLTCEPGNPGRVILPANIRVGRGSLLDIKTRLPWGEASILPAPRGSQAPRITPVNHGSGAKYRSEKPVRKNGSGRPPFGGQRKKWKDE